MHFQGQIKIIGMQASIVAPFAPWSCGMIYLLTFSGCELASLLVHGALEEVDDALERQDAQALYRALQDPILTLRCLQRDNLDHYLEQLSMDRQQKALVKAGRSLQARGTHAGVAPQDCNGPQEEGASPLGRGLLCGSAAFCKGSECGCSVSTSRFWCDTRSPSFCPLQELGYIDLLEQEELEAGILMVNKKGEEEQASEWLGSTCCLQQVLLPGASPAGRLAKCPTGDGAWSPPATHPCQLTLVFPSVLRAVSRINAAIRRGMPAKTLEVLMDPAAQLPRVYPLAAPLYQCQLALLQHQHPRVRDLPGMGSGSNRLWGDLCLC